MLKANGIYLITGGTGFLGRALIKRLLKRYPGIDLRVVARNEGKLVELKNDHPEVEIIPGDIADELIARKAMVGSVNGVFHLAAFKHVTMAEKHAYECVRSNIIGTLNLMELSLNERPDFFVNISTDKAAQVRGVYGATKMIGERLAAEMSALNPDTLYLTIRYGNVFRSTGSFIYKWEQAAREGREIVLTDPEATRFFFSVHDAVSLILDGVCYGKADGADGILIPRIKGVSMGVFAEAFSEISGAKVTVSGLQPGENKHETMDGDIFSNQVAQYTKDEIKELILCPMP